jgi:HEAT repeat protein
MTRATIFAAVLFCALPLAAQNPTPAPPAPPIPATPPADIDMPDMPDMADVPDVPDAPDIADMRDLPDMALMAPLPNVDFDLIGPALAPLDALSDMDLDIEMPDFPEIPEIPEVPDVPDIPPVAMTPMIAMRANPMIPVPATPRMAIRAAVPTVPGVTPLVAIAAAPSVGWRSRFDSQFGPITSNPPEAWAQADPADSLYRLARVALNRGEYRHAADLFGEISQKFPNSVYATDARYWRAFSLYRIGGREDLRVALVALQDSGRGFRQQSLQTDAPALAARIRGALARSGDESAKQALEAAASQPGACDREDLAVRVEALNSLGQTDPESTTPILRRVLARRDDCSASLRRAALYLLGRRTDDEARDLIIGAARNDPEIRVRGEALRFLAAMPGDQPIATIEEMARTPGNEQLQRAAIAALGRSDSPRARQSLHSIIERIDVPENIRATALASVDPGHSGDNGAYVRSIYPRLDTPRLKAEALRSIARIGGPENDQFLLSIVRNQNEPSDVRAAALRSVGRSSIPITDLTRMYDAADDRRLREQLIGLFARRDEAQATDKLLEIARNGTDPDMRRYAISALSRKNDPRTRKLLLEIIDK